MTDLAVSARASNRYFDRNFACDAVKILPGEYYVTESNMVLVTVLGSCVSACIRDPGLRIGGLNHFMLPDTGSDPSALASSSARYGTNAMELLINQLIKLGARRSHLEVKVFGGGNVLNGLTVADVGARNAAFVLDYLQRESMSVLAKDLVGPYPRKIYFFPATGKVLVKKLKSTHNNTIAQREQDYRKRIGEVKVGGEVELFI
ncbi:MAG TPA: chemoreceptor glutamine deamidase CheD [Burkholderiales bacterium]|nr:chemoreceptor glutamine deamidase CheD [Burkholderiales bacterium]